MTEKTINVRLVDQGEGKIIEAELPVEVSISQLLPAIIKKLNLPNDTKYELQHKESGKKLESEDTLKSAGVEDGDTLRLVPGVVGG